MIRVLFDNTEVDGNYISRIEQHVKPFNDNFVIGNTVCREFNLDVHNNGFSSTPNIVHIYEDNGSNTVANWSKYATLLVDTSELQDGDYTTFNLTDAMVRFNQDLTYTQNDTVKTILTSICTAKGISLATQSFYMDDFSITWTDELTERDFISYVAEVNGGFAYINADGNLVIESYSSTPAGSIDINQVAYYKIGERHYIDRVYVELASATKYYPATNTYDTLYLNPENILYNDAQGYTIDGIIQHIYSVVNGLEFYNIRIQNCPALPNIHACQVVKFGETGNWTPFICTVDWSYNTSWRGGYDIELECKIQEETRIVSTPELVRRINIKVDREAGEIRQEVSDLDDSVTAALLLKVDKDGDEIISLINASADNIIFNTKSLIFGEYPNGQYIEVKNFASGNTNVGVTFDGTGYVRFQPQEQFVVNNITSGGDLLNEFVMSKTGNNNHAYVTLKNYDDSNNLLANAIDMDTCLLDYSSNSYNELGIKNYSTATGVQYLGNALAFQAKASSNSTSLKNYVVGSNTLTANSFSMSASSSNMNFGLYNYGTTGQYVVSQNSMSASCSSSNTQFNFTNCIAGRGDSANSITMYGTTLNGTSNWIRINNYDMDSNNLSGQIYMYKSTSENWIQFNMNRGGTLVGEVSLTRDNNGMTILLKCYANQTYGYSTSQIALSSNGNINAWGTHFYWNGAQKW